MKHRNWMAHLVAAIGGGVVLTEVARYWLFAHAMEGSVIGVGAAFGFIGAYMSDRRGAIEGAGFMVNQFERVVQVVRTGRRETDVAVVVTEQPKEQSDEVRN